ncbi:MAG: TlpA family protein disulfide reductase [Gemmatimonadetes bacterium]|nr:TlpA family protein disulfide reductase [Gemmatimonadota bacterium]
MRRWTGVALALAAAATMGAATDGAAQDVSLPLGATVPDAGLEDLDGNPVRLQDAIGGRPALLQVWATWCPLCEELQPQLDRIRAEHGDGLAMVAIAVAVNQNPRRIKRHLERHALGFPVLYDARGEAVRGLEAATTSIVVLLDAEGRVAYTGVGADQDLVAAVESLLGG